MPRQSARVQDDPISEDLLASIPVVAGGKETEGTTFNIESEEPIAMPPPAGDGAIAMGAGPPGALGAALSQQLRYELGEALARELDRASETFARSIAEIESRLAQAESALMSTHQELERERTARESAEKRLVAFKELALK